MPDCFWEGGYKCYLDALEKEHQQVLRELYAQCASCVDPQEKAKLRTAIDNAERNYRQKRKQADDLLF